MSKYNSFIERWQKNSSFGFLALALCLGKNHMCCLCVGLLACLQRSWLWVSVFLSKLFY